MEPGAPESAAATSKKAAKKAEAKAKKEAQKAQRAAERVTAAVADVELDDPAKDYYGRVTATFPATFSPDAEEVNLRSLGEAHDGKTVIVRAWLQNARSQSAKMAFVELREEGNWTIQGVVMATATATGGGDAGAASQATTPVVSRPMVKWINGIAPESFVAVEAKVQRPLEPVKSCRVTGYELHITRCFTLAPRARHARLDPGGGEPRRGQLQRRGCRAGRGRQGRQGRRGPGAVRQHAHPPRQHRHA